MTGPLWLSVQVGIGCAIVGLPIALLFGYVLARKRFVGRTLLSTALMLPLVLPPVVTGYLLLRVFGAQGLDVGIVFTRWAALIAALVVALPLYVSTVRIAIASVEPRYEEVARTLGLTAWQAWWRVTFPLALPGIAAGFVLTFARSLGEFGATAVFAGNVEGETRTLALAVYSLLDAPDGEPAAMRLVGLSVAVSAAALFAFERLTRRV